MHLSRFSGDGLLQQFSQQDRSYCAFVVYCLHICLSRSRIRAKQWLPLPSDDGTKRALLRWALWADWFEDNPLAWQESEDSRSARSSRCDHIGHGRLWSILRCLFCPYRTVHGPETLVLSSFNPVLNIFCNTVSGIPEGNSRGWKGPIRQTIRRTPWRVQKRSDREELTNCFIHTKFAATSESWFFLVLVQLQRYLGWGSIWLSCNLRDCKGCHVRITSPRLKQSCNRRTIIEMRGFYQVGCLEDETYGIKNNEELRTVLKRKWKT